LRLRQSANACLKNDEDYVQGGNVKPELAFESTRMPGSCTAFRREVSHETKHCIGGSFVRSRCSVVGHLANIGTRIAECDVVVSSIQSTPTTHTIGVRDNYFQPSILQVLPGDTVRWVNQGQHNHTVTTQDGRDYPLARGASIALTFHSPGRFSYHCRFHPLQRMAGVILVGAGVRAENNASPRFEVIEGVSSLVSEPCCEETR
jgi:plastocyanin